MLLDRSAQSIGDLSDDSDDDDNFVCTRRQKPSDTCSIQIILCSKLGRTIFFMLSLLTLYLVYANVANTYTHKVVVSSDHTIAPNITQLIAHKILSNLCDAYTNGVLSGDICNRICYHKNWTIIDFYQGNKVVITLKEGGQEIILKSQHPKIADFQSLDPRVSESAFTDALLGIVNYNLRLGWPDHYKQHLIEIIWPMHERTSHKPLSQADRRSVWALISQDEYVTFRVLPLSRLTPQVIGSCGHFYQVEKLVAFRMKGYYMNLKSKILLHLMGTLKLFDEFLNEPLQWCDVKFDNLGLASDYPKRFMIMDADMLYTKSRMNDVLNKRGCKIDDDCVFFDCQAKCINETGFCSDRTNSNLEVFCQKLVYQLFGTYWTKSNRYLAACRDPSMTVEEKMLDLRRIWSWSLSDV